MQQKCSSYRNVAIQNSMEQTGSIDNNTEMLDHNRPEHEMSAPIDSNFQRASLHFRCCERRAMPNAALSDNPF